LTTTILVFIALSVGVCLGYILCAVMMVANEEQLREARREIPADAPLEPESLV
jgi:hypothetical protein